LYFVHWPYDYGIFLRRVVFLWEKWSFVNHPLFLSLDFLIASPTHNVGQPGLFVFKNAKHGIHFTFNLIFELICVGYVQYIAWQTASECGNNNLMGTFSWSMSGCCWNYPQAEIRRFVINLFSYMYMQNYQCILKCILQNYKCSMYF